MNAAARPLSTIAMLVIALVTAGCNDDEPQPLSNAPASHEDRGVSLIATLADCEAISPRRGWRRQATSVGQFGLMVKHVADQARELPSGNYLVKAGAVLVGDVSVTLGVPDALVGQVGLVYGKRTRGPAPPLARVPTHITFEPCEDRPRSGYVGGLIFDGEPRDIVLEVRSSGTVERLALRR